jgi:hypothetical protein
MAYGSFGNACWHYRAKYVGNDNDGYFLVLIL